MLVYIYVWKTSYSFAAPRVFERAVSVVVPNNYTLNGEFLKDETGEIYEAFDIYVLAQCEIDGFSFFSE